MLSSILLENGFRRSVEDSCIFHYANELAKEYVWTAVYVDDILVAASNDSLVMSFKSLLEKQVRIKINPCNHFLGIEVIQENDCIMIHQQAYIKKMLEDFEVKFHPFRLQETPLPPGCNLTPFDVDTDKETEISTYRSAIGSLNYVSCASRPDICFAVNRLAQFLSKPSQRHLQLVCHLFGYLKKYPYLPIRYSSAISAVLQEFPMMGYVDADHGSNDADRRSTTGYVIFAARGPISWYSKKQDSASGGGSSESEYKALYSVCCELLFLRQLVEDIGFAPLKPTKVLEDNTAVISVVNGNVQSSKLKHVAIKLQAIKEWIADGQVLVTYCETQDQIADILTKSTTTVIFHSLLARLLCAGGL